MILRFRRLGIGDTLPEDGEVEGVDREIDV